mmetsp:Transcript_8083/g.10539  ORF Transcript_8083/g.10539 Transcript_8083/m.10539 type:complete len:149 (+) Transcript_8083:19-465(+)
MTEGLGSVERLVEVRQAVQTLLDYGFQDFTPQELLAQLNARQSSKAAAAPAGAAAVEPRAAEESGEGKSDLGNVRIHVRNLSANTTTEQLKDLFMPYGEVLEGEVETSQEGVCSGNGFVVMPTADEAAKAVAELNQKMVDGKELVVQI